MSGPRASLLQVLDVPVGVAAASAAGAERPHAVPVRCLRLLLLRGPAVGGPGAAAPHRVRGQDQALPPLQVNRTITLGVNRISAGKMHAERNGRSVMEATTTLLRQLVL